MVTKEVEIQRIRDYYAKRFEKLSHQPGAIAHLKAEMEKEIKKVERRRK